MMHRNMDRNHYRAGRDDYYERWLYTEDEAARFCKYGFGRPHRESPMDPDQAHINAVYYTRVKLKCMFGVDDPEQYSKDLIISAWKVLQFSEHYDRVASLILIGEVLSGADHVTCTVQEMIDAMNSDVTAYRDPWAVALNLRLVWEEAHNTPSTKRLKLMSADTIDAEDHSFTSHVVDETAAGDAPVPETTFGRCGMLDENHERAEAEQEHVHQPPGEEEEEGKQQFEEAHVDNANKGDGESQI